MNQLLRDLLRLFPLAILCVALAACGGEKEPSGDGEHADHDETEEHGHAHEGRHGGALVESNDHSMHFEIVHDAGAGLVKLWLYDGDMQPMTTSEVPVVNIPLESGPVQVKGVCPKGGSSATEWHFSHKALAGHVHEARVRVLAKDRSYMVDFPDDHDGHDGDDHGHEHDGDEHGHDDHDGHAHDEDGDDHEGHEHDGDEHGHDDHDGHAHDEDGDDHKGHEHDGDAHGHDDHEGHEHDGHDHDGHGHAGEGPHHGLVQPFASTDGKVTGFVELKLHDDKGDLELWIATDKGITKPFDLPLASKVTVTFTSMKARSVKLQVRNTDKNEDEDGVANNRDGNTNYFIYPGDTGADAKWLQGKTFEATVRVAFDTPKGTLTTQAFTLKPHTH